MLAVEIEILAGNPICQSPNKGMEWDRLLRRRPLMLNVGMEEQIPYCWGELRFVLPRFQQDQTRAETRRRRDGQERCKRHERVGQYPWATHRFRMERNSSPPLHPCDSAREKGLTVQFLVVSASASRDGESEGTALSTAHRIRPRGTSRPALHSWCSQLTTDRTEF